MICLAGEHPGVGAPEFIRRQKLTAGQGYEKTSAGWGKGKKASRIILATEERYVFILTYQIYTGS
jgi:hypothetical protein